MALAPWSPSQWWGGELLTSSHPASYFISVVFTKPNQPAPQAALRPPAPATETPGHPRLKPE